MHSLLVVNYFITITKAVQQRKTFYTECVEFLHFKQLYHKNTPFGNYQE